MRDVQLSNVVGVFCPFSFVSLCVETWLYYETPHSFPCVYSTNVPDNAINDLCSPRETSIVGKTVFTFLNPRRWPSLEGAVCRCTAESVRYPTTNTIAVFVVDMRLNLFRQSQCSKVSNNNTIYKYRFDLTSITYTF